MEDSHGRTLGGFRKYIGKTTLGLVAPEDMLRFEQGHSGRAVSAARLSETAAIMRRRGTVAHIWVATECSFAKGWYRFPMTGSDGVFRSINVNTTLGICARCANG